MHDHVKIIKSTTIGSSLTTLNKRNSGGYLIKTEGSCPYVHIKKLCNCPQHYFSYTVPLLFYVTNSLCGYAPLVPWILCK